MTIKESDIIKINELKKQGLTYTEIAKEVGCGRSNRKRIRNDCCLHEQKALRTRNSHEKKFPMGTICKTLQLRTHKNENTPVYKDRWVSRNKLHHSVDRKREKVSF